MKKLFICLFISLIALAGCKKEEGPTGPKGDPGTNGNANVKAFTYSNQAWVNQGSTYEIILPVSAITQAIQDKGNVQVFASTNGGTTWAGLPFSAAGYSWVYASEVGKIHIDAYGYTTAPNPISVKVVVTEGN